MICMEIKETIEAQRGDTHFNVENPNRVKNHGGAEAQSIMRNVYMWGEYNKSSTQDKPSDKCSRQKTALLMM